MFLMIDTGLMSPVRGWLRRAERLLDGQDDGPVHAVVATVRAYERFMCGDMASARRHADLAVGLGQRLGNQAAEVIGRTAGARITILEGRVDEGLEQLGEGEGEGEFVFTRADGKPIHPDFFSQSWQRLVRESGLRRSGSTTFATPMPRSC
jgi:hypothetical protein